MFSAWVVKWSLFPKNLQANTKEKRTLATLTTNTLVCSLLLSAFGMLLLSTLSLVMLPHKRLLVYLSVRYILLNGIGKCVCLCIFIYIYIIFYNMHTFLFVCFFTWVIIN